MTDELDFESLVNLYYASLYRFALSLTHKESDARDLTQQTFYVWATKGHQLQDTTKVKSWLFTTLHREFLEGQRRQTRFPHHELEEVVHELPKVDPELVNRLESAGFVRRQRAAEDRREVLLYLTPHGEKVLQQLSLDHREELRSQGPVLLEALQQLLANSKNGRRRK